LAGVERVFKKATEAVVDGTTSEMAGRWVYHTSGKGRLGDSGAYKVTVSDESSQPGAWV
jgi:hypothetical protein